MRWRMYSCLPPRHSCRGLALARLWQASRRVSTRHARVRAPRKSSRLAKIFKTSAAKPAKSQRRIYAVTMAAAIASLWSWFHGGPMVFRTWRK